MRLVDNDKILVDTTITTIPLRIELSLHIPIIYFSFLQAEVGMWCSLTL